jgi:hypothetical protein
MCTIRLIYEVSTTLLNANNSLDVQDNSEKSLCKTAQIVTWPDSRGGGT